MEDVAVLLADTRVGCCSLADEGMLNLCSLCQLEGEKRCGGIHTSIVHDTPVAQFAPLGIASQPNLERCSSPRPRSVGQTSRLDGCGIRSRACLEDAGWFRRQACVWPGRRLGPRGRRLLPWSVSKEVDVRMKIVGTGRQDLRAYSEQDRALWHES